MKKRLFCVLMACFFLFAAIDAQIIADHTVISKFDLIPDNWIDSVKKMMVAFPGESHSAAYRTGMELLMADNGGFACNIASGEGYTDQYVRVEDFGWIGENVWFTAGAGSWIKTNITRYYNDGHPFIALGFGWCSDLTGGDIASMTDQEFGVQWYGRSSGGPEGNLPWGLEAEDYALTSNTVSLQTYFDAMEEYVEHCETHSPVTNMVYTTGPVNPSSYWEGERGYQGHIKHEAIRAHVGENASRILFDYADILCYDESGNLSTQVWNGHTFPSIANANYKPEQTGHISNIGAIRLAKAQWWLLARIAGWDGTVDDDDHSPPSVPDGITVIEVSENVVTITWNASSDDVGVSKYSVYRDGLLISTTSELVYTDSNFEGCGGFIYTVSASDEAENESSHSDGIIVNNCPDLTATMTLSPNISHGSAFVNVVVRVTELNGVNSDGHIAVQIPIDSRWELYGDFDESLSELKNIILNNSDWSYTTDVTNHIFSTSSMISSGGYSAFGFRIIFTPDANRGSYNFAAQLVVVGTSDMRSENNSDSEKIDFFW